MLVHRWGTTAPPTRRSRPGRPRRSPSPHRGSSFPTAAHRRRPCGVPGGGVPAPGAGEDPGVRSGPGQAEAGLRREAVASFGTSITSPAGSRAGIGRPPGNESAMTNLLRLGWRCGLGRCESRFLALDELPSQVGAVLHLPPDDAESSGSRLSLSLEDRIVELPVGRALDGILHLGVLVRHALDPAELLALPI